MTKQAILALLLTLWSSVNSEVLRVPQQYGTIQSALDAASDGDTVLVATGVYHEALSTPEARIVLLGDTSNVGGRPIVDPSPLSGSDSLAAFRGNGTRQTVQSIEFRNRSSMFPRHGDVSGGIIQDCDTLELTDCVFDSLYDGIVATQSGRELTLSNCSFVSSLNYCVRTTSDCRLLAESCDFHGTATGWALITGYGASSIDNCTFRDQGTQGGLLLLSGHDWSLESCVFQGAQQASSGWEVFSLTGSGLVRACTFSDDDIGRPLITFRPSGEGIQVLAASFDHLSWPTEVPPQPVGCLAVLAASSEVPITTIEDCSATACSGGADGVWLWTEAPVVARHNRVFRTGGTSSSAAYFHAAAHVLRDNRFEDNCIATATGADATVDAIWNYWGDSTGPYHQGNNPGGLGDTVLGFVDFDPWYTDTLFWNGASPEPHPQLPDELKLTVYPNPFNATTTLELYAPKAQIVEVKLYDLLGREVMQLFKGPAIDVTRVVVNGAELASGIYFARASDPIRQRSLAEAKMLLVK